MGPLITIFEPAYIPWTSGYCTEAFWFANPSPGEPFLLTLNQFTPDTTGFPEFTLTVREAGDITEATGKKILNVGVGNEAYSDQSTKVLVWTIQTTAPYVYVHCMTDDMGESGYTSNANFFILSESSKVK